MRTTSFVNSTRIRDVSTSNTSFVQINTKTSLLDRWFGDILFLLLLSDCFGRS